MTIDEVPGLQFHLRADTGLCRDAAGTTPASADGDPVGRWEDLGPHGYHLTQPDDAARPTLLLDSGFKGRPAVRFSSLAGQWLSSPAFDRTAGARAGTWVVAMTATTSSAGCVLCPASLGFVVDFQGGGAYYLWTSVAAYEHGSIVHPAARGDLMIARYDGSASDSAGRLRLSLNKSDRTLAFGGQPIGASLPAGPPGLYVGKARPPAATFLDGLILEAAYFDRALSEAEVAGLRADFGARYFDRGLKSVHCVGDSLTKGYPFNTSDGRDWPTLLGGLLGGGWTVRGHSIVAYSIAQLEPTARTAVDPDRDEWRARDVVIHQGGTNNMGPGGYWEHSAEQTLAELKVSVAARKARGFEVMAVTVPPVGPAALPDAGHMATFEVRRTAYNDALRAGASGADGLVDWAADPRLADPTDATYFYSGDQCHLMAAGNQAAAELARDAIARLAGGLPDPDPDPDDPPPDPEPDDDLRTLIDRATLAIGLLRDRVVRRARVRLQRAEADVDAARADLAEAEALPGDDETA